MHPGAETGGQARARAPPRHFKYTNVEKLRTAKPIIIHEKKKGHCEIQ